MLAVPHTANFPSIHPCIYQQNKQHNVQTAINRNTYLFNNNRINNYDVLNGVPNRRGSPAVKTAVHHSNTTVNNEH